jgi:hypothetical protein
MFFLLNDLIDTAYALSNPEIWLGALIVVLAGLNYIQYKQKKDGDSVYEEKLKSERDRSDIKDEKLFDIATKTGATLQEFTAALTAFQNQSNEKDSEVLRIVSDLNSGVSELGAVIKVILSLKKDE